MRNYIDKVRLYLPFSNEETTSFLMTVAAFAFMKSFNQWGTESFNLNEGLINYLIAAIIVGLSFFVHHAGQRLAGLYYGVKAEQKIWWYGIIIALVITLVTRGSLGNFGFFAASSTTITILAAHRLGKIRYGANISILGKTAIAGPVFNIFLASLTKTTSWIFPSLNQVFMQDLFVFNIWIAFINFLPIPPLDGSKAFFASRSKYAFAFSTIISYILLFTIFNVYSYILSLTIGIAVWFLWILHIEKKWFE